MASEPSKSEARIKEEIEKYEIQQGVAISSLIAKIITYACSKLQETFNAPLEEVLEFLDQNPDLLDFSILDEHLNKLNMPMRVAINTLVRSVGVVIKTKENWKKELIENGTTYILEVLKRFNPNLYNVLKDKQNILNFIKSYIIYKLGI